mgnify:CR=1 FL=1
MVRYSADDMMVADGKNTLMSVGVNDDVIACELACYDKWKNQPRELVQDLVGSVDEKCEAIFGYLTDNVVYKLDDAGNQYIKSPARLLADGCGDCKSLTMFIACCLHCLGIEHIIRFVNYDGGKQYTHVYPVAIDECGREIVLDACEKDADGVILYDYARACKKHKDFRFV